MEKIRRTIKLFFARNAGMLSFIIYFFIITICIVQILNKFTYYTTEESNTEVNNISVITKESKYYQEEEQYILKFIDFCNNNEVEKAYAMLSDNCKKEKYKNIKEFEKYINDIFKIKICDSTVIKEDNIYTVELLQDVLATGKKNSVIKQVYKVEGIIERKIFILN